MIQALVLLIIFAVSFSALWAGDAMLARRISQDRHIHYSPELLDAINQAPGAFEALLNKRRYEVQEISDLLHIAISTQHIDKVRLLLTHLHEMLRDQSLDAQHVYAAPLMSLHRELEVGISRGKISRELYEEMEKMLIESPLLVSYYQKLVESYLTQWSYLLVGFSRRLNDQQFTALRLKELFPHVPQVIINATVSRFYQSRAIKKN